MNPADLMTKPLPGPKIVQLMKILGREFADQHLERDGLRCTKQVSTTCRTKFDRGVIAVGCGAVSDKNCWMV